MLKPGELDVKGSLQEVAEGMMNQTDFMRRAIVLSEEALHSHRGGPFGAVIVKDNVILAEGSNGVTSTNDPTAHAEIVVIRQACTVLHSFRLPGCDIYTSCEPCPMCLGAIYWARLDRIYYANTRQDAARIGFDDAFLYEEIPLSIEQRMIPATRLLATEASAVFAAWDRQVGKIRY